MPNVSTVYERIGHPLVFVDVETTGTSARFGKVIEIGALRVENGRVVDELNTLVDPGAPLPRFTISLTGISDDDMSGAPAFRQVADRLTELLDGAVLVAHNVYFDYSFLRAELDRIGREWSPRMLCTVRLSRALYPFERRHNLESVIARHGIKVGRRHRAYDDAWALTRFLDSAVRGLGTDAVYAAVTAQLKKQALPAHVPPQLVANLPEKPGVYVFEGAAGEPLYVGKSVNIRSRVMSHFSDMKRSDREVRIAQNVTHISTLVTEGELGALLKESQLIKALQPLHNRRLRHRVDMWVAFREFDNHGYYRLRLERTPSIDPEEFGGVLRIYRSRKQATEHLIIASAGHRLCRKLLAIERGDGCCFARQLGKCEGACEALEPNLEYNLRFMQAFANAEGSEWPFGGAVGICEGAVTFVFDKWCLRAEIAENDDGDMKVKFYQPDLDLDVYHILRSYLRTAVNMKKVRELPEHWMEAAAN
jgi:DNA polymerase-3 subunit epsilon